jgi:hypothetical protein
MVLLKGIFGSGEFGKAVDHLPRVRENHDAMEVVMLFSLPGGP